MPAALEIPTTLAHARGGYTATARFGEHADPAQLILDTGSSTLVVRPHAYRAQRDRQLSATPWVQEIRYGGGAWAGPVLRSRLAFGHGHHARAIDDALFACCETDDVLFQGADGLWGLAYRNLDPAWDVSPLLAQQGHAPALSWPWPYERGHALDLDRFQDFLHHQPRTHLQPAFTALEEEGVVRNLFALAIGRAVAHVVHDKPSVAMLEADPLNRGALVLGGGSEQQHLYRGAFQDIRIVHDLYYNANLRTVRVGGNDPFPVPPLDASRVAAMGSNALLDTGCSFLVLDAGTYAAVIETLAARDARLPALVEQSRQALGEGNGLAWHAVDAVDWPDLHFGFEAPDGGTTEVRVPASHYWPRNALGPGRTLCLLSSALPHFGGQSILGLPLFAGRYAVFDRGLAGASGTVRLASLRA
ncbi:pepsin-like aspartic protease [Arenimonas donghaensis]|uniref:Peptidase A1 domain-containing protein n=1 Tax=Arenimonas donghaensis DSM 18148 = HO3-R19 TaxID=1121014 RepID=A0A087MJ76_9GAMM|nr:pepsin-like aspartic protease [Arenimonas donghaensis]KFL36929.1 hypothetical protein N788_12435 [Arenimonas donghaensis DSM 18148 = HO3-R19]